jgi:hypothetical protein
VTVGVLINKRLLLVWLILCAITLMYIWIDGAADSNGVLMAGTAGTVLAIGLALVKVRIIMREFMEVRHAPRFLRALTDLWIVVMAGALLGTYLVGRAIA